MFKKNTKHLQPALISAASELPEKQLKLLKGSWAHTFYHEFFCRIDEALTGSLLKAGVIGEQHRPKPLSEMYIAVDGTIKEGDTVDVDGISLDVLQTPGHSDCSLSFHEPKRQILLVSDATGYYLPEHHCWWPNYFTGYDVYLESMRRLAGLGAETLCLSHNAVQGFTNHPL